MAITFTPAIGPSPGTGKTLEMARWETTSVDGYVQRAPLGTNYVREKHTLQWPVLTHAQADSIEAELLSAYGVVALSYAVPPSTTAKLWTCTTWTRTEEDQLQSSISAEFVEVFDP